MPIEAITIDPKLVRVYGRFTADERKAIEAERDTHIRQTIQDFNDFGKILRIFRIDQDFIDAVDTQNEGMALAFAAAASAPKSLQPLRFGFIKEQGKAEPSLMVQSGDTAIKTIELGYPKSWPKEYSQGLSHYIKQHHLAINDHLASSLETLESLKRGDHARKGAHAVGIDVLKAKLEENGILIGTRLASELFFAVSYLYPNKTNPFPLMALGRKPDFT